MSRARMTQFVRKGWSHVVLESDALRVTILPEKGGDIASIVSKASDVELLWQSRWGLRERGIVVGPGSSEAVVTGTSSGGWQTVFPNGGAPCVEHGVDWGLHGEVLATPFEWVFAADGALQMQAHLTRSPFLVRKSVRVEHAVITVTESVFNEGGQPIDVMWGHHPTFGAPLLAEGAEVWTNGTRVDHDVSDLAYGVGAHPENWPKYRDREGARHDLSVIPPPLSGQSRLAFLGGFPAQAKLGLRNKALGLGVELRWSSRDLPWAWYWLEAGAGTGFPWYGTAYVLGLEPFTSWPAAGVTNVRRLTGSHVSIVPGETRSLRLQLAVTGQ